MERAFLLPHRLGAALLALGPLAGALSAQAQTVDHKFAISAYATTLQYRGDLGSNFWDSRQLPVGAGIGLNQYVSKGFDFTLAFDWAKLRYPADPGTFTSGGLANGRRFDAQRYYGGLGFKFKLPIRDEFFLHPYLLIQPGFSWTMTNRYANSNPGVNNFTRFGAFDGQAAAGLDFHLGLNAILFVQVGQHYLLTPDERLDGSAVRSDGFWDEHDRYMQFSAGLRANLGKPKDTDMDGVPDRKDKCPSTPQGVKVDANGCPLDRDNDGVPDYQDQCPDQKGTAATQGCPDSDNDGVADPQDRCPNTPAGVRVDANGCPLDSDGDGVPDNQDRCPNTPRGVRVDANGCPADSDGDGVPDYQDRCPNRPGPASNKGCPEIKAEQRKVLNEATQYIQFDFNKATLKSSSNTRLNQIVQILNEYPDYSLSIAGHTDSKGDDNYNLRLSYERAAAARRYLLNHGVAAERIEARGYGETKPIASNDSEAGRALNRRVDFDPYLTGETNAAETKYGAAPTISELRSEGQKLPGKKTTGTGAPRSRKAPAQKPSPRRTTRPRR